MSGMTRECAVLREHLPELAEGLLAGRLRERAERHLAACPRCAAELADLRAVISATRSVSPDPLPAHLVTSVQEALRRAKPAPVSPLPGLPARGLPLRGWPRLVAPAVAAGLLLAVALAFTIGRNPPGRRKGAELALPPTEMAKLPRPSGGMERLRPKRFAQARVAPRTPAKRSDAGNVPTTTPMASAPAQAPPELGLSRPTRHPAPGPKGLRRGAGLGAQAPKPALKQDVPATLPVMLYDHSEEGAARGGAREGAPSLWREAAMGEAHPRRAGGQQSVEGRPPAGRDTASAATKHSVASEHGPAGKAPLAEYGATSASTEAPPVWARMEITTQPELGVSGPAGGGGAGGGAARGMGDSAHQLALTVGPGSSQPLADVSVVIRTASGERVVLWRGCLQGPTTVAFPAGSLGSGPAALPLVIETDRGSRQYVLFLPIMARLPETAPQVPATHYDGQLLGQAFAALAEMSGLVLLVEAPLDRPVHGPLPAGDPDAVLERLATAADFRVCQEGDAMRTLTRAATQ